MGQLILPCQLPLCRGLEPAIFRLRGKGVSITLARMDQFTFNLGVILSNFSPPEVFMENGDGDLRHLVRAYGELDTANSVHGRTAAKRPSVAESESCGK